MNKLLKAILPIILVLAFLSVGCSVGFERAGIEKNLSKIIPWLIQAMIPAS